MTCHRGSVTKKRPVPRQAQRKTRKLAVQTSSKAIGTMDNDERRGRRPMTVFPESATPADIASVTAGSETINGSGRRSEACTDRSPIELTRSVRARFGGNPHPAARSENDWKVAAFEY